MLIIPATIKSVPGVMWLLFTNNLAAYFELIKVFRLFSDGVPDITDSTDNLES